MKKVYQKVQTGGVDVHYRFSTVSMRGEKGLVCRERLDHHDRHALRAKLATWPQGVPWVLEASFGWGWLYDEMVKAGLTVALSNCLKVEKMRKARGWVKTNNKDADLLSLLPLEATDWWKVWPAPPEVRDLREWVRLRMAMVGLQTATKNRISALFHRHGIVHDFSDLFGGAGRRFLAELCRMGCTEQVALPEGALAALRHQVRLLEHLRGQLAEIQRRLHRALQGDDLSRRLDGAPGFGKVLTHALMAEVGQMERFANHRRLASYSLLAPQSQDTGEPTPGRAPIGRHLGVRGNRTLKWIFLEAAHGAVKSGGRWRAMFDRATAGGTQDRQRGYIKVARELVKVVYVIWAKGVEYQETPPPRPGSRRERMREMLTGTPRPGTGQPYQPMAGVQ